MAQADHQTDRQCVEKKGQKGAIPSEFYQKLVDPLRKEHNFTEVREVGRARMVPFEATTEKELSYTASFQVS